MPIIAEPNDRPGCLPGTKDEPFLPAIKSINSESNKFPNNNHNSNASNNSSPSCSNSNKSYKSHNKSDNSSSNNNNDISGMETSRFPKEYLRDGQKAHASAPGSESSTPFKLPSIDRSKSNSVSSLSSERYGPKQSRGRSRDRRAKLCRSPSCPSNLGYWQDDAEEDGQGSPDTSRLSTDITPSNTFVRPFFTHREDLTDVKLPNIFQHRSTMNSSFTLTSSTANSSAQNSRDTSPFSFKRDPTFLSLTRKDTSPDGMKNKQNTRREAENSFERSGTQSSALLLPISSGADAKHGSKGKRKRKKMNGILNSSDGHSEAEKLLREKLGAIERRDNGISPSRENEKTDLSDTAFIDKVKDETMMANGDTSSTYSGARESRMSDHLSSKPPLYQNTQTRIKTEKNITSVKA